MPEKLKKINLHPFIQRLLASVMVSGLALASLVAGFLYAANEIGIFSDSVIEQADDLLWGPGFGQQHSVYKLKRTMYLQPDLLILGSSRVTQFRDVMAPVGKRFYNASLAASSVGGARAFLSSLYGHHVPDTVLLGIDPWWFSPGRSGQSASNDNIAPIDDFNYQAWISSAVTVGAKIRVFKNIMGENLRQKADPLAGRKPVGYHAALSGNGFRADGSYQYGDILMGRNRQMKISRMGVAEGFHYYRQQVLSNLGRFHYSDQLDSAELTLLRRTVQEAQDQGVNVVLFFPPMAAKVMEAVRDTPSQAAYFDNIEKAVSAIATEFGVEFHNFHDLGALNVSDAHTIDGIHVDEIASLAMLRKMMSASPVLASFYDQKEILRLDKMIQRSEDWAGPHRVVP